MPRKKKRENGILVERARLSELLKTARESKGWSREKAAEMAGGDLNCHHVVYFEQCPLHPLREPARRDRLSALAEALGVDFAEVNRLAGGI